MYGQAVARVRLSYARLRAAVNVCSARTRVKATRAVRVASRKMTRLAAVMRIVMVAGAFCGSYAMALDGSVELLREAAERHRVSRASLATWTGAATIEDKLYLGSQLLQSQLSRVSFAHDAARGALRWNRHVEEAVQYIDGQARPADVATTTAGLLKDGVFTATDLLERDGKRQMTALVYGSEHASFGPVSDTFNPMLFFGLNGEDLTAALLRFVVVAERNGEDGLTVTLEGSRMVLDSVFAIGFNKYVVDLAQGANLVEYNAVTGPMTTDYEITYANLDGVWVPSVFTYTNGDDRRVAKRIVQWTESVVNGDVNDDDFALYRLGIQSGDLIRDTRSGTIVRFEPASVPAAAPAADERSAKGRWLALVAVNALIALICVGFFVVKYRRAKAYAKPS